MSASCSCPKDSPGIRSTHCPTHGTCNCCHGAHCPTHDEPERFVNVLGVEQSCGNCGSLDHLGCDKGI